MIEFAEKEEVAAPEPASLPGIQVEPAPAKKPTKAPRRDKGTARLVVPKGLAKQLEADAKLAGLSLAELLVDWRELAARQAVAALPKAVLTILEPAAEATGRSMTDLIEEYSVFLVALLTGELYRDGPDPKHSPCDKHTRIPSMADFLTERFRAKLEGR